MTAATTARPTRNALGRFLRLITPLRVPLLFAVILAGWPLVLPLAWLALLTYCGVWLIRDKLRSPVVWRKRCVLAGKTQHSVSCFQRIPHPLPGAGAAAGSKSFRTHNRRR